jgi:hypothetical protein
MVVLNYCNLCKYRLFAKITLSLRQIPDRVGDSAQGMRSHGSRSSNLKLARPSKV